MQRNSLSSKTLLKDSPQRLASKTLFNAKLLAMSKLPSIVVSCSIRTRALTFENFGQGRLQKQLGPESGSEFSELIPISALEKQNILSALDVVARLLPANKEWLSLPEVFVLAMPPSARKLERSWHDHPLANEDHSASVYTLKEQKGFYDLGQGHKSPAFKHHLPVFERRADAERCSSLSRGPA